MSEFDKKKWNEKYRADPVLLSREGPTDFLRRHAELLKGECAVDLACGGGRNAIFLAQNGFCVDAVDISEVALQSLRRKIGDLPVRPVLADLDTFSPASDRYDLAVMAHFLDRDLIARTAAALKAGGLFVVETYMAHPDNEKRGNPDFLLAPEELKRLFEGWKILAYEEFVNSPEERYRMMKQGIVAKKGMGD